MSFSPEFTRQFRILVGDPAVYSETDQVEVPDVTGFAETGTVSPADLGEDPAVLYTTDADKADAAIQQTLMEVYS